VANFHPHTDVDTALTGTWFMDEVRLAMEKVYGLLEIHEVYQYQITHFNRETGEGRLFVDYINTFLKLKVEARGYPSWVRTPDDEDCYIQQFKVSEGIRLNKDSTRYNPAKQGQVKL
jgi:hypothetical protein